MESFSDDGAGGDDDGESEEVRSPAAAAAETPSSDRLLTANIFTNSLEAFYSQIFGERFASKFFGLLSDWHVKKVEMNEKYYGGVGDANTFNDEIAQFHKSFMEKIANSFLATRPYKISPRPNKKKVPISRFYHSSNTFSIEIKSGDPRNYNGNFAPPKDFLLIYSN